MSRLSVAAGSPTPAAALDDGILLEEILEEILLRLPPQPSSLPRASLVCTRWRSILSDAGFHRRFREHHGRNNPPPLLGFFDEEIRIGGPPIFTPTMGQRDHIPPARFSSPWSRGEGWTFLGCRHGLALLICRARREALVWDPLTGHQRRFHQGSVWNKESSFRTHGDCRFTPFRLALVGCSVGRDSNRTHKFACLYESESGVWGDIVSVGTTHSICPVKPSVLVRDSFCWLLAGGGILEFDFRSQSLVVTQKPADAHATDDCYCPFSWYGQIIVVWALLFCRS